MLQQRATRVTSTHHAGAMGVMLLRHADASPGMITTQLAHPGWLSQDGAARCANPGFQLHKIGGAEKQSTAVLHCVAEVHSIAAPLWRGVAHGQVCMPCVLHDRCTGYRGGTTGHAVCQVPNKVADSCATNKSSAPTTNIKVNAYRADITAPMITTEARAKASQDKARALSTQAIHSKDPGRAGTAP